MRLGVRGKVVVSAGTIVLGLLIVNGWIADVKTRRLLVDGVMARADSLAGRLQEPIQSFIRASVPFTMFDSFSGDARRMVETSGGLLESAAFVDADGVVQIHSDRTLIGSREPNPAVLEAIPKLEEAAAVVPAARGIVVLTPVRDISGKLVGTIELVFSDRPLAAERRKALLEQGVLLVIFLGVTVLALSSLLGRTVTRPLGAVGAAAKAIAEGRLDERVPVRGHDEIAVLGRRFNEMSDQLAGSSRPSSTPCRAPRGRSVSPPRRWPATRGACGRARTPSTGHSSGRRPRSRSSTARRRRSRSASRWCPRRPSRPRRRASSSGRRPRR
jgi:HAMP domain-containing protein